MHKIYKLNSIFKATSKTRAVCISWAFWAHHHFVLFHEYELTESVSMYRLHPTETKATMILSLSVLKS